MFDWQKTVSTETILVSGIVKSHSAPNVVNTVGVWWYLLHFWSKETCFFDENSALSERVDNDSLIPKFSKNTKQVIFSSACRLAIYTREINISYLFLCPKHKLVPLSSKCSWGKNVILHWRNWAFCKNTSRWTPMFKFWTIILIRDCRSSESTIKWFVKGFPRNNSVKNSIAEKYRCSGKIFFSSWKCSWRG